MGFSCDGLVSIFCVMFKELVEVLFNVNYMVCVMFKGLDFYYGIKGLCKVIYELFIMGVKICFIFCYVVGNNNGIFVEDG